MFLPLDRKFFQREGISNPFIQHTAGFPWIPKEQHQELEPTRSGLSTANIINSTNSIILVIAVIVTVLLIVLIVLVVLLLIIKWKFNSAEGKKQFHSN